MDQELLSLRSFTIYQPVGADVHQSQLTQPASFTVGNVHMVRLSPSGEIGYRAACQVHDRVFLICAVRQISFVMWMMGSVSCQLEVLLLLAMMCLAVKAGLSLCSVQIL